MEAALAAIGLLSPATVDRAGERLERFETLAGSTPGELLQVANVACWKWAAGTAAETVEHGRRSLAAARAQAADASDSVPIYEALWVLCYADAHELALSVLDDTLADARGRGSVFGDLDVVRAARPDRTAARRRHRRRAGSAHRGRAAGAVGLRAPAAVRRARAGAGRARRPRGRRARDRGERLRAEPARVRLPQPRVLRARAWCASRRAGTRRRWPTSTSSGSARPGSR